MTHIESWNLFTPRVLRVLAISIIVVALATPIFSSGATSHAQEDKDDGVKVYQYDEGNSIIPKPGSGVSPESATDRGGALQITLLGLLILFPVVAFVSVRRQGKRNLREL